MISARSALLVAVLGMSGVPAVLSAQYPGQELLPPYEQVRAQYVAMMYREVQPVIARWREGIERADLKTLAAMLETDALFSPVEGWIARNRVEVADSLGPRLSKIHGYIPKPYDFTASGNLAFVFGHLGYALTDGNGVHRDVRGTFTMVLFLRGKTWRVRAYIEREGEF
jgi:ketosteroid isomerase-like protein